MEGVPERPGVSISGQGLRDRHFGPKGDDEFRILVLGDSFTFGYCEWENTIPQRLEQLLSTITTWDLFLAFLIVDGCTPGKSRKSLIWFFDQIGERVDSRVSTDWLI